jgi:cell division transport system ATP-binding protein
MRVIEASPKLIKRQVPNALSLVGLMDKADQYPDQLS